MSNQIFVIVEHLKGSIEDITFEMLGKGKEIAGATDKTTCRTHYFKEDLLN